MSRSPNIEAITAALRMVPDIEREWSEAATRELAAHLAARGVLAVDSLSDEQLDALPEHGEYFGADATEDAAIRADKRAALRRCATGEP